MFLYSKARLTYKALLKPLLNTLQHRDLKNLKLLSL